jgi:outer membrane protein assembly factor BamB
MKTRNASTPPRPCPEWVEQLNALHWGDLPLNKRVELDQHLETCSPCQAVLAEYRATDALITSLPPVEPLPAMPARLQELVGVSDEDIQAGLTHTAQETPVPPATPTSVNLSHGRLTKKLNLAVAVLMVAAILAGFLVLFPALHPRSVSQQPSLIFASQHNTPLYLATSGPDSVADAMNSTDSTIIWQQHLGHQLIKSPLAAGENVYFPSVDGNIYALRASDGHPLWHARVGSPNFPIMGLFAYQDLIIVGTENGDLVALRASSGSIAWHFQDPCASGKIKRVSSEPYPCSLVPLVLVNGVVYGFADGLYAWNASNGQVIWRNPAYQAESLVVSHGKVYVPYGYIVVLDASNGHFLHALGRPGIYDLLAANDTTIYLQGSTGLHQSSLWKNKTDELLAFRLSNDTLLWQRTLSIPGALFNVSASSIYLGDDIGAGNLGHIAVGTDLYSWRASDGSQQWHWHDSADDGFVGGLGVVSAFEINGIVCYSTTNGIYGLQASTGRLLWHAFPGRSMAGPVFQGQLIVSPIGA